MNKPNKIDLQFEVISSFLNGKQRDAIAKELGISTGKVSAIIKEWKKRTNAPDIDELREFAVIIRKSGMTIEQCAMGHRIICILKILGIYDEEKENDIDEYNQNYNFLSFIKDIYLNCKNFKINPLVVFSWIKDLFECYFILNNDYFCLSTKSESKGCDLIYNKINSNTDTDQLKINRLDENETANFDLENNTNSQLENKEPLKTKENDKSIIDISNTDLYNQTNPFISQISEDIYAKKRECFRLQKEKIILESKLKELYKTINVANDRLASTYKKEEMVLYYLEWFYKLKKDLWDFYSISIENISNFAKVISEFERHHYDAYQIISEYQRLLSVRNEIITKETCIKTLEQRESSLNGKIVSLEYRLSFVNHRTDIYEDLEAMGFGIKELGQLRSLFVEICDANNISLKEAGSKFFKDIKEQYDYKLGFEIKINEQKAEIEKIKSEYPEYRYNLHLQYLVDTVLVQLIQSGVTKEDIININLLITEFANDRLLLSAEDQVKYSKYKDDGKAIDRIHCVKIFLEKLRELGNINLKLKEQQEKLDSITKRICDLEHQEKEIDIQISNSVYSLCFMHNLIHILNAYLIHHLYKQIYKKNSSNFKITLVLLLKILYIDYSDKNENAKED